MDDEDRYTRITLRIPKDLDQRLQTHADATSKSKNAEIIGRLQISLLADELVTEDASPVTDTESLNVKIDRLTQLVELLLSKKKGK